MKRLISVAVVATLMPFAGVAGSHDDDGTGIRVGSFIARPSATISQGYNSNIFRDETGKTDSFITVASVRGQLESDWNRHGLRLDTGLEYGLYANSTDDNYLDGFAEVTGALDLQRDMRLVASAGYSREHDRRGDDDVVGGEDEPVVFDRFSASLRGEIGFGRFRVDPFVEAAYRNFYDADAIGGGEIEEDDRDRLEGEAGVEFGYSVRRGYEAFIRTSYLWTDYDDAVDSAGIDRDSMGYRILGGVKVDLTRFITASVGVGYYEEDFEDSALDDTRGFSSDAEVQWFITRRTTLFGAASVDTDATTVAGASSVVDSRGSFGVTHELRRNLNISGSATYTDRDFKGISRNDDLYSGRIGAEWMVNRRIAITPEYKYSARDSNGVGDYDVHEVRVSATFRF